MRITLLLLLLTTTSISYSDRREYVIYLDEIVIESPEARIRRVFVDNGISPEFTEILIAQASMESGNFSSRLFVKWNNAFGMRHPTVRQTTSIGAFASAEGRTGYASYDSIEDSALDMVLYLRARRIPEYVKVKPYIIHLKKKGYFEDSLKRYTKAVESYV